MKRLLILCVPLIIVSCGQSQKKKQIMVVPLGIVAQHDIDTVASALRSGFPFAIHVMKRTAIPARFKVAIKSPRYRADSILQFLRRIKPDSVDHMVAITSEDISVTKTEFGKVKEPAEKYRDWGVFGYGYRPGPACVVSTFRLGRNNRSLLFTRLKKVAIHELGHNLGLPHCDDDGCPMQDAAESISTVDRAGSALCNACRDRAE
ncbi:MAG TPA: archaemetzincin [Chryseosolibacter sp.]|nr:archaemetzincin [Chryseosolibacter sp.]